MQLLSRSQFEKLSQSARDCSLSIYLPTHVAGPEIQQDPIRLKNLLGEAEQQLQNAGMAKQSIGSMLASAYGLLENERFWRYQSQGLALFITPEETNLYRLPLDFESLVVVTSRFHLKPLLPLYFENRYFYILALSQNQVKLFQSTRHSISEIPLEGVPTSMAEALRYDDPEEQLNFHNVSGNGSVPTYHGHGVGTTADKEGIRRYFAKVNSGLHAYLNQEDAPLVTASVDYLRPIYGEVNTYDHLMDEGVNGNPDQAQPDDLREQAWPLVHSLIEADYQKAMANFQDMKGTGKASDQLEQLVTAAVQGQVEVLFTVAGAHCWGQFDPTTRQVKRHDQPHPQDQDLLDIAAVQTYLQGGEVYTLGQDTMPTDAPAAAVYRYGVPAEV